MKSLTVSFLATAAHSFHFATLQNRLFNSKRFLRSWNKKIELTEVAAKNRSEHHIPLSTSFRSWGNYWLKWRCLSDTSSVSLAQIRMGPVRYFTPSQVRMLVRWSGSPFSYNSSQRMIRRYVSFRHTINGRGINLAFFLEVSCLCENSATERMLGRSRALRRLFLMQGLILVSRDPNSTVQRLLLNFLWGWTSVQK